MDYRKPDQTRVIVLLARPSVINLSLSISNKAGICLNFKDEDEKLDIVQY